MKQLLLDLLSEVRDLREVVQEIRKDAEAARIA